jgi:cephalosporin-C deacetylase-like acetyl esterase
MNRETQKIGWFLFPLAILLSGCLYSGPVQRDVSGGMTDAAPAPVILEPHDYFAYTPLVTHPKVRRTEDRGSFTFQKLQFPTFTAYYYLPKRNQPAPGIIVLPISNGNTHADQMAEYLAINGYPSLRFKTRKEILANSRKEDPVQSFEENYRAYIRDILQGVDWMATQPAVDSERMGLVGISLGAVTGAIVNGLDPRIRASVLILGGGDLAGILMTSDEPSVRKVRDTLRKNEGLTDREIREILESELYLFDPIYYADDEYRSQVLMINALMDQVIRREYSQALWEALGKPRLIEVPAGHYTAILFLPYAKQKALEHFRSRLGE